MPNCVLCGAGCISRYCRGCYAKAMSNVTGKAVYTSPCRHCHAPTRNQSGLCDGCYLVSQQTAIRCSACGQASMFCDCVLCLGCGATLLLKFAQANNVMCAPCSRRTTKPPPPIRSCPNCLAKIRPSGSCACVASGASRCMSCFMPTPLGRVCTNCATPSYHAPSPWTGTYGPATGSQPNMRSQSVRIWWDPQVSAYKMVTPFNVNFVETLKSLIPVSDRVWDPGAKQWTFHEAYLEPIKTLCDKVYGMPNVLTKQQVEASASASGSTGGHSMSSTKGSPLDVTICSFFRLLPYDAAKTAFRKAAMELHPDKQNGDSSKMSDLNMAWSRIEKDLYGR